ncbi:hypothetical protein [uncultured Clostridium sp.]|uniref:hypothetical protein n=1 Tax=uncultured Clostridium sp. TaxID=59620 RepID=UPI002626548F|nr:hypothetical protein [uncultured Clostridium sp.]
MHEKNYKLEENSLYIEVKNSAKKSFEEYYYSFWFLSVFIIGAFALYISTRVSRGIFIIIDVVLIYKISRSLYELKRNKNREHLALEYQLKFLNRIYMYSGIFLVESIVRHFLSFNITIFSYIGIMAIIYGIAFAIYKVARIYMKRYYIRMLEENNYKKIVEWKTLKHKLLVIISFFIFVILVISTFMKIVKGDALVYIMTFMYTILLIINIEIKCDLEIEEELLFKEGSFDFEKYEFN